METLITVVILGILAAILVPNLIKNQVENANRTKVKKAMAAYEKAINMMIIENDIKSTENLRELGQDNCQYTREYFKTVQDGENNCIFKTADRVWWDISDITNPILILKDSQLEKSETELKTLAKNVNDNTTFAMVGRFDDLGTLRINDNGYEQGLENNLTNQKYVGKLWYFITQSTSVLTGLQKCDAQKETTCTLTINGVEITYNNYKATSSASIHYACSYKKGTAMRCNGYNSVATTGDYWVTDNLGQISEDDAKSEDTCNSSSWGYTNCKNNGDYYEAAKLKCQKSGGHLPKLGELETARQNGKLPNGTFWAFEEYSNARAYSMRHDGNVNSNNGTNKNNSGIKVICIGDN